MVRANQGGSVLSFLIIGGVLVALLIGGVYFVRNRANDTIARATTDQQKKPDSSHETMTTKSDDKKAGSKTTETKPDASKQEAPAPKPSSTPPAASRPAELPQTGPAETAITMFGASLLVGAATAYYRSRSQRHAL